MKRLDTLFEEHPHPGGNDKAKSQRMEKISEAFCEESGCDCTHDLK